MPDEVIELLENDKKIIGVKTKKGEYFADYVVLATGGCSYPLTGSDGKGYELSKALGHSIVTPKPSLIPIVTKEKWVADLMGLSLKNIEISVINKKGKKIYKDFGEQKEHKELSPAWIYQIFEDRYINDNSVFSVVEAHFTQHNGIVAEVTIEQNEGKRVIKSTGNGRLDAVSNAFKQYFNISYELSVYEEHSLSKGSSSKAVSYVGISCNEKMYWGVGLDEDIIKSSIHALAVAVNQLVETIGEKKFQDERLTEILNYINTNYLTVTLDELADEFHLSKPYLSKYIKDKSGKTFGDLVKNVRMKKARTLLKSGNMTVEAIADKVGYQNVEHFTRLFKKKYGMTPVQFRNNK